MENAFSLDFELYIELPLNVNYRVCQVALLYSVLYIWSYDVDKSILYTVTVIMLNKMKLLQPLSAHQLEKESLKSFLYKNLCTFTHIPCDFYL